MFRGNTNNLLTVVSSQVFQSNNNTFPLPGTYVGCVKKWSPDPKEGLLLGNNCYAGMSSLLGAGSASKIGNAVGIQRFCDGCAWILIRAWPPFIIKWPFFKSYLVHGQVNILYMISNILIVVALLGATNKDTKAELSLRNILTKNCNATYKNERVTRATVSVWMSGLSAGILLSA